MLDQFGEALPSYMLPMYMAPCMASFLGASS
jgi:hypothetical protein